MPNLIFFYFLLFLFSLARSREKGHLIYRLKQNTNSLFNVSIKLLQQKKAKKMFFGKEFFERMSTYELTFAAAAAVLSHRSLVISPLKASTKGPDVSFSTLIVQGITNRANRYCRECNGCGCKGRDNRDNWSLYRPNPRYDRPCR
jgi:hypothetical protein